MRQKPGPKPKKPGQKQTAALTLRFTESEKDEVNEAARLVGLRPATLGRIILLEEARKNNANNR